MQRRLFRKPPRHSWNAIAAVAEAPALVSEAAAAFLDPSAAVAEAPALVSEVAAAFFELSAAPAEALALASDVAAAFFEPRAAEAESAACYTLSSSPSNASPTSSEA